MLGKDVDTMKKFTNVSNYQKKLAAIAVCGALVISGVSFSMSQADASTSAALIGMGKGADIALSDAGLKENQVLRQLHLRISPQRCRWQYPAG